MKKILAFLLVMILLCPAVLRVFAGESYENVEDMPEFEKHIVNLIADKYSSKAIFEYGCYYDQVYSYLSGEASNDETTAEYILFIFNSMGAISPMSGVEYIGEYVVYHGSYYSPYKLGYFVYVPERDEVYTLEDAYYENINGIEKAFIEGCYSASLAGDANVDGKLNVKDATTIQKQLAGLLPLYPLELIEKLGAGDTTLYYAVKDFNLDEVINIKDATAIQKHLAGLEY